MQYW